MTSAPNTDSPSVRLPGRWTSGIRGAIHALERPGHVMLDAGDGSGILPFLDVETGAVAKPGNPRSTPDQSRTGQ